MLSNNFVIQFNISIVHQTSLFKDIDKTFYLRIALALKDDCDDCDDDMC